MSEARWWEVAEACEHATFFHTPLWASFARAARADAAPAPRLIRFPDGREAVYPLVRTGPARGAQLHSSWAGCYGGPIWEGRLTPRHVAVAHERIAQSSRAALSVLTSPFDDHAAWPARFSGQPESTHLLDLEDGYEAVRARFSRGHRSSIAKAERAGLEVRPAGDESDYRAYFAVYQDSLRRWGDRATSAYPWEVFELAGRTATQHPELVRLWIAALDGRVVSGALVFAFNGHAVYWHGATARTDFAIRPANGLFAAIIREACERGLRWFDFNPSGGHAGPAEFKRRFGAHERPLARLSVVPAHQRTLRRVAEAVRSVPRRTRS